MDKRLIRLTTHDDRAIFDNSFNQDIQINPNSKVSLINCTAQIKDKVIVTQGDNRNFTYNLGHPTDAPENFSILLNEAVYSSSNFKTLITDFETKLLQSINPREHTGAGTTGNNRMIGLTWEMGVEEDSKAQICWTQSAIGQYANETGKPERQVLVNARRYTGQNGLYVREGGTAGTKDSFVSWKQPLQYGGGVFAGQVANFTDHGAAANNGMIFCLINKDPTGLTTIADSDIVIGLQPVEENVSFKTWKNGTQDDADGFDFLPIEGENDPNNVKFEIKYKLGGLTCGIYRFDDGGGAAGEYNELINLTATEVSALTNGIQTKLFPCMIMLGEKAANTSNPVLVAGTNNFGLINMRSVVYTPLKLTLDTSIAHFIHDGTIEPLTANNRPVQIMATRENFINFGSLELAEYFGYLNQRVPKTGTISARDHHKYVANRDFKGSLVNSENYIFQLLSHDLDCYDGLTSSRKNILMTMPQVIGANQLLTFSTNTPIPISFKNHSGFSLRNIRARILDYDNQEVAVTGLSNATLLIEG